MQMCVLEFKLNLKKQRKEGIQFYKTRAKGEIVI